MPKLNILFFAVFSSLSFITQAEELRIYAASSMTNVVNKVVQQFQITHDIHVTTVYGSSASLARQLAHGAPADIFISANQKWMEYLIKQGITSSDGVTYVVSNQLVVIAPLSSNVELDIQNSGSWLSALNGSRLAVGQTNAVPAGIYAKESLTRLGVWDELRTFLAPTSNVRIALALVERAESPLGIVYYTDALLNENVTIVTVLPENSHSDIVYPMAMLNSATETQQFVDFWNAPHIRSLVSEFGFKDVRERG